MKARHAGGTATVVAMVAACSSAWPAACRDTLSGVRCDCRTARLVVLPSADGAPRPAGRVIVLCDGERLPVVLDADDVTVPGTQ